MSIISHELAQKLVNYIMKIVPYNINIIDESGLIIASGHPERIGLEHKAGLSAIRNNRIEAVSVDQNGMKPGVNMPIRYRDSLCGVVGISGPVDEIMNIASLVRCTIELLIEQEALLNTRQAGHLVKAQFLHEWLNLSSPPTAEFIARGRQQQVAVTSTRTCAVIGLRDPAADGSACFARLETYFDHSRLDNYVIRMSDNELTVILNSTQPVDEQTQLILDLVPEVCLGLGRQENVMRRSYMQARSALRLGRILKPEERVHDYAPYRHFDAMIFGLDKLGMLNEPLPTISALQTDEGNALIDTLLTYYRLNGECTRTAQSLHIHRNTLNYRLEKITGLTGLNPRNPMDLQRLIGDYVIWCRQPNPSRA